MNPDTETTSNTNPDMPEQDVAAKCDGSFETDATDAATQGEAQNAATQGEAQNAAAQGEAQNADTHGETQDATVESTPDDESAKENTDDAADSAASAQDREIAALKDRLLRLQADFDNYRKRQARERAEWIAQSNADLLEDLLPALDQTDLALSAAGNNPPEAAKPFIEGFSLVRKSFLSAVAKHGLEPVGSTVGKPLDITTSEAVTVMRTGQAKPGCVLYETRKGYTLGGKLLRAAQVVVEAEAEDGGDASAGEPEADKDAAPAEAPAEGEAKQTKEGAAGDNARTAETEA